MAYRLKVLSEWSRVSTRHRRTSLFSYFINRLKVSSGYLENRITLPTDIDVPSFPIILGVKYKIALTVLGKFAISEFTSEPPNSNRIYLTIPDCLEYFNGTLDKSLYSYKVGDILVDNYEQQLEITQV